MRFIVLAPLALLLSAPLPPCQARWGSGRCTTVVVPEWEWRYSPDGSRADLYHFGQYWRTHYYETEVRNPAPVLSTDKTSPKKKLCDCCPCCGCGDECRCAAGQPCGDGCTCGGKGDPFPKWMTHGTNPEKIAPREEYRIAGQLVSKDEAMQALRAGQLADDSGKLRLTVIGSPDERKQALSGLPQDVKDRCLVKEYAADHWAVKNAGFKTDGHPTVYVQAPDGKVLHRQDDAVNVAGAVRKADPNYDASKDPDLRKPKAPDPPAPTPTPDPNHNSSAGWVVAGLIALGAYLWKGSKTS
jgi:hypothetical protein